MSLNLGVPNGEGISQKRVALNIENSTFYDNAAKLPEFNIASRIQT
jgi:hypothetical protein